MKPFRFLFLTCFLIALFSCADKKISTEKQVDAEVQEVKSSNAVLDFIKSNPEKSAIKLVRNEEVLAEKNLDKVMPLASTMKIIIAIEYAEQAARGTIDVDALIPLDELDKYFVPLTDGGAHQAWLKHAEGKVIDEKIPVREVAKGMIWFSSNANTEWLSDYLGLGNINARIKSLGLKNHTDIYYIVSSLFVGKEKFPSLKGDALINELENMRIEDYIVATETIHNKLKTDSLYRTDVGDLSMNVQRIWSDRLPASTVNDYASLMKKINSRSYLSKETHLYLDEVMEFLLENPKNRAWLEHTGMKGGSTAFVLTKALYATDKEGNKTELAYFFNELDFVTNLRLQQSMNDFELKILSDASFRKEVQQTLK